MRSRLIIPVLMSLTLLAGFLCASAAAEDAPRKVTVRVNPVYPELAKRVNVRGTVKLAVEVAPNGVVKDVRVMGGHPLLVQAAQDAVRKWKYEPGAGVTTSIVEIHFAGNE